MNIRNITITIAVILVIAAAWKVSEERAPATEVAAGRLYPELIDQMNDIQRVSIHTRSNGTELAKTGDGWVVANSDDYPANISAIKRLLLNLSEVTVIEKKTSKPENYARIGVQAVEDQDSESVLVSVEHRDGTELVSLIIGNERAGNKLDSPNYYVRESNAAAALLVEGELKVSADRQEWMETKLVNVDTARVRSVAIERGEETPIAVSKEQRSDNFFTLQAIPTGFTAKSRAVVSSLGAVLLDVKFEDVAAAEKVADLSPSAISKVQTFDGLVATLEQFDVEDKAYVKFRFEFDPDIVVPVAKEDGGKESADSDQRPAVPKAEEPPSIADEAAKLNATVADWVYVLPDYKMRMLDKKFDDMIKPIEAAPKDAAGE
jgi:Domain of unknown function (DUF4340)